MSVTRNSLIAILAAATPVAGSVAADFCHGMFLICEGQYGADYGSLAFFGNDGSCIYHAFAQENPGYNLGTTSQSGCCRGDNIYIVSKEAAGGGFLTVMDASTLKYKGALSELPGHCQAFYLSAVSDDKGYLSTSEGLYVINLADMTVAGRVSAPGLSSGMFGQSLCVDGKLYVVSRRDGIVVLDTDTDGVLKILPVMGASAIASSPDGYVYVATTVPSTEIVKISTASYTSEKIDISGINAALTDQWDSWSLQPFAYDYKNDALLIAARGASEVGRYNLRTGEFVNDFIRLPETSNAYGNCLYGQGISISPYDGSVALIAVEAAGDAFSDCSRVYFADADTGTLRQESTISMPEGYWFPAQVLFPAAVSSLEQTTPDLPDTDYSGPVFTPTGTEVLRHADITAVKALPAGIYIFGNRKIAVR